MARNLSEHLLDMVEQDPRFIGLTASSVLAWLKIIRLLDRNSKRRDVPHVGSTSWDEMRLHLHISSDRLLTLMDNLHAYGLLTYSRGWFLPPAEVMSVVNTQPHIKRLRERAAREDEAFRRSEEGRQLADESGDS